MDRGRRLVDSDARQVRVSDGRGRRIGVRMDFDDEQAGVVELGAGSLVVEIRAERIRAGDRVAGIRSDSLLLVPESEGHGGGGAASTVHLFGFGEASEQGGGREIQQP